MMQKAGGYPPFQKKKEKQDKFNLKSYFCLPAFIFPFNICYSEISPIFLTQKI